MARHSTISAILVESMAIAASNSTRSTETSVSNTSRGTATATIPAAITVLQLEHEEKPENLIFKFNGNDFQTRNGTPHYLIG